MLKMAERLCAHEMKLFDHECATTSVAQKFAELEAWSKGRGRAFATLQRLQYLNSQLDHQRRLLLEKEQMIQHFGCLTPAETKTYNYFEIFSSVLNFANKLKDREGSVELRSSTLNPDMNMHSNMNINMNTNLTINLHMRMHSVQTNT